MPEKNPGRNPASRVRLLLMRNDERSGVPIFDSNQLEIPESLWNQVESVHLEAVNAFERWHIKRKELIDKMCIVSSELSSLEKNCNVSTVVGSSMGVAGGVAIIAGLAMPPVAIGGLIVSGAAATSNLITSVVKIRMVKKRLNEVDELLHQDAHNFEALKEAMIELGKYMDMIKKQYPQLEKADVSLSAGGIFSALKIGSTGIAAAVRSALLKETAAVSTTVARGAVRAVAFVGIVLDSITVTFTTLDMVKGSPSVIAEELRMAYDDLERHYVENCHVVSMQLDCDNPVPATCVSLGYKKVDDFDSSPAE